MQIFLKISSKILITYFLFFNVSVNATEYKDYDDWNKSSLEYIGQFPRSKLSPSFQCRGSLSKDEDLVCSDSYWLPGLDNMFSSYYTFLMKNVEKEDKGEVIRIAKKMLKKRGACPTNEEDLKTSYGISDCISFEYAQGIKNFLWFLASYKDGKYYKYYKQIFRPLGLDKMREMGTDWASDILGYLIMNGIANMDGTLKVVSPRAKSIIDPAFEYIKQFEGSRLPPSFPCSGELKADQVFICTKSDNYFIPALDNLFTSFYNLMREWTRDEDLNALQNVFSNTLDERLACMKSSDTDSINACMNKVYTEGVYGLSKLLLSYDNNTYTFYDSILRSRSLEILAKKWRKVTHIYPYPVIYDFTEYDRINLDGTIKPKPD